MFLKWVIVVTLPATLALDNGLALTPPMGWMSWLGFGCETDCKTNPNTCLSENLIKRTADRMVSDGYLAVGYQYIIIDDCWMEMKRGPDGRLVPSKDRFPYGIKALSDYVHSKGLKFGIYEDWGNLTCQGYPGVLGHEETDIQTFVEWEVDFLKLDGCYADTKAMDQGYTAFGEMLNKTGRPILYSCSWPAYQEFANIQANYSAIAKACNIWRNWGDVDKSWGNILSIMDWFGDNQDRLLPFAGPGHFHDPDQLVFGFPEVSPSEASAQMSVWTALAAPLLMSADLDTIQPEYKKILLNKALIECNQDKLGIQGKRIQHNDTVDVWKRSLVNNRTLCVVVKRSANSTGTLTYTLESLGLPSKGTYDVMDIFDEQFQKVLSAEASLSVTFPQTDSPGARAFLITKRKDQDSNTVSCGACCKL